jgi:TetR/AcrR family transcriptional repressor for divergent bdcA
MAGSLNFCIERYKYGRPDPLQGRFVVIAKISAPRGRPRGFDTEAALALGQRLFHAHGYDAVGVAALTEALGIKPPSFYAAFGSKAGFFEQVLERYARSTLSAADILVPGRAPGEALADLLEAAAREYAKDPELGGCLVLEAARGDCRPESGQLARQLAGRRHEEVRRFVALSKPEAAEAAADYIVAAMSGLSASARQGVGEERLVAIARAAAAGLGALLAA